MYRAYRLRSLDPTKKMGSTPGTLRKAETKKAHQDTIDPNPPAMDCARKMDDIDIPETVKQADEIRRHQGNHETEILCGGEADRVLHSQRCLKNPGHSQFKPVQDFKMEDLPPDHRNDAVFYWIQSEADLTCRLLVERISENRPKYHSEHPDVLYPFYQDRGRDLMRVGTGWLAGVKKYTEEDGEDCTCNECRRPGAGTPRKVWGKAQILTACHVVFDDEEATHTTCYFADYISTPRRDCLGLEGLKVEAKDVKGDRCVMAYVSHNMDIINNLEEMCENHENLWDNVMGIYGHGPEENTNPGVPASPCVGDPTYVISYPHGLSKQISFGMLTEKQEFEKFPHQNDDGSGANMMNARYTYSAATCPGSSGAPIFIMPKRENWWARSGVFHSEGSKDKEGSNSNSSGVWMVMDSLISDTT